MRTGWWMLFCLLAAAPCACADETSTGAGAAGAGAGAGAGGGGLANGSCDGCDAESCICLPPVPPGWQPIALSVSGEDSCPEGYADSTRWLQDVTDPGCGACECEEAFVQCAVTVLLYEQSNCLGMATYQTGYGETCVGVSASVPKVGVSVSGSGTCEPSAEPLPPEPAGMVDACAPTGLLDAPCGDGGVCAPAGSAPYDSLCITQPGGEAACPAGYPSRTVVYDDFDDARVCGGCSCGAVSNINCPTTVKQCSSGCSNCTSDLPISTCMDASPGAIRVTPDVGSGVTCPPSGSAGSDGNLSLKDPRVICCQ